MEIDGSKNGGNGEDDAQIDNNSLEDMPGTQENEDKEDDDDWLVRRQEKRRGDLD